MGYTKQCAGTPAPWMWHALCLLVAFVCYATAQGGAGPIGGSIADYYDQAFGNPFLGYWKNPGNRNPYGSHTNPYQYGGVAGPSQGSPYGTPYNSGMDRASLSVPSPLYDRLSTNGVYGGYGYNGGVGGMGPYPPYGYPAGMYPNGGAYGGGGFYPGGGLGYPGGFGDAARTPADRGLQDLLPSSYSYKPWYP